MTSLPAARLLVVDDDHAFRVSTSALLREDGYDVTVAGDAKEALTTLRSNRFDLMLLDLRLPGVDGLRVAEALRLWGEDIPILMISGFGTVESAVAALHLGVDDFLSKPVEPDVLSSRVAGLLERRPGADQRNGSSFAGMIGRSESMRAVFDSIRRVAPTEATVLVTGETGTGKELVARAVHAHSARRDRPFLAINCAALAEGLLESELFGHVRGAFTGAVAEKPGLFEAARGGTLFLDEIGDMPLVVQQRLLRVIQEREVLPVGSVKAIPVDVRIVAATRRNLREQVAAGRFREDLFYRLNVFSIWLPPLRERPADIPLLVEARLPALRGARKRLTCSPLAMRMLRAHSWPGNVRELLAAMESSSIRADGERIDAQHLPPEIRAGADDTASAGARPERYRASVPGDDEREAIVAALEQAEGSRARTAEILGMGRTTLWRRMRMYGLAGSDDPE